MTWRNLAATFLATTFMLTAPVVAETQIIATMSKAVWSDCNAANGAAGKATAGAGNHCGEFKTALNDTKKERKQTREKGSKTAKGKKAEKGVKKTKPKKTIKKIKK